jgi:hypothetical protein
MPKFKTRSGSMKLDGKELAAVLCGLRLLQQEYDHRTGSLNTRSERLELLRQRFPEHFRDARPLNSEEIDDLCQRLNCKG